MKIHRILSALAIALLCALPAGVLPLAVAQTPGAVSPQQETPERLLRFYYISYASTEDEHAPARADFDVQSGDERHSFSLGANSFSPLLRYRGSVPVSLFKETRDPDGELVRVPLASLDFPSAWKGVLFLAIHDPAQAASSFAFRFFPVEYWREAVAMGNIRLLNLTRHPLAMQLGRSEGSVAAGGELLLPLPGDNKPMAFRVAQGEPDGNWKIYVSSVIPPFADDRALMIFYPATADGRGVRMITISNLPQ